MWKNRILIYHIVRPSLIIVANEALDMLRNHAKIWISTYGLGVPYLHVRIDTRPKYYHTSKFL